MFFRDEKSQNQLIKALEFLLFKAIQGEIQGLTAAVTIDRLKSESEYIAVGMTEKLHKLEGISLLAAMETGCCNGNLPPNSASIYLINQTYQMNESCKNPKNPDSSVYESSN